MDDPKQDTGNITQRPRDAERRLRRLEHLAIGALLMTILSLTGMWIVVGDVRDLASIIISIPIEILLGTLVFIVASEIVKALRLYIISRMLGVRLSFTGAVIARFMGRWAALLSPASMASTPVRAGIIGAYSGSSIGEATAISILETVYDIILPLAVTITVGILGLPSTWFLLATSVIIAGLWIAGFIFAKTPTTEEVVFKLTRRKAWWCYARRQRLLFLSVIEKSIAPNIIVASLATTILAHIVEALAVGVASGWENNLLWWIVVLEVSYAMMMTPTPGGALLFEYGLGSLLPPRELVYWRLSYVISGIIPGTGIFLLVPRIREYLREAGRDIEECTI